MRKKGYILATDFPAQVKDVINNTMGEYKTEISNALQKAEKALATAKTVERFNQDLEKNQEENKEDRFDLEL